MLEIVVPWATEGILLLTQLPFGILKVGGRNEPWGVTVESIGGGRSGGDRWLSCWEVQTGTLLLWRLTVVVSYSPPLLLPTLDCTAAVKGAGMWLRPVGSGEYSPSAGVNR